MWRDLLLRVYLGLSGAIFLLVAVLHFSRIAGHWAILVGPFTVPHLLSWVGGPVATLYAVCAFVLLAWQIRRQAA